MAWNDSGGSGGNGGKDPWGNRGQQQPPDLDEALKKLQTKVNKLFSRGGRGGSGGSSAGAGFPGGTIGTAVIAIALAVIWVISGIFIVGPAEEAVILRFGKYKETMGPGPHWIPRFIDSKYVANVQKVSNFSYNAPMLTKDENIVSVQVAVQYRIGDLRQYFFNIVNPRESLQEATASALRQVVGHTTLDEVLTTGRAVVRAEVEKQLGTLLKRYQAGIVLTDVVMQPAKPPDEVKAAFDDAIKAQEDEQRFINQAQSYARRVTPIAQGQAKRIMQEAEAYKKQVILRARGEVSRFLAMLKEYQAAPRVTRERLYLDAVQQVLTNNHKILVDVKGSNNMFYLPLDQLLQKQRVMLKRSPELDSLGTTPAKVSSSSSKVSQPARLGGSRPQERMGRGSSFTRELF